MNKREFEHLIAAYGASPARWPEERRAAGETFLKTHPDAQSLMAPEAVLDAALDSVEINDPSAFLRSRILKSVTGKAAHPTPARKSRPKWYAIAAAFVAVFAVGLVSYNVSQPAPAENNDDAVWVEAANDLGVSDIYDWVNAQDGQ